MYIDMIAEMNEINSENVYMAIQRDVRETVFGAIYTYMHKSEQNKLLVRKIYSRYENNLDAARLVVQKVCGCTLLEEEIRWLDQCLRASMRKRGRRKRYTQLEQEAVWRKQKERCAICGRQVPFQDSHLTYKISWNFVGDELPDNLQILCSDCNSRRDPRLARGVYNVLCANCLPLRINTGTRR